MLVHVSLLLRLYFSLIVPHCSMGLTWVVLRSFFFLLFFFFFRRLLFLSLFCPVQNIMTVCFIFHWCVCVCVCVSHAWLYRNDEVVFHRVIMIMILSRYGRYEEEGEGKKRRRDRGKATSDPSGAVWTTRQCRRCSCIDLIRDEG